MATLREGIGKRVLKRKKKNFSREVKVHNFNTARSVVLLFDTSETGAFQVIKDFRKFIEGKGITSWAFGYVNQKEIPEEMLFWKNYSFITRKNLTWYLKPFGESVEAFYAADPDILIDFTHNLPLELQFLVHLSSARFKVGCFTESENDYDLMINLGEPKDMDFLAHQFKHYIAMLNPVN